MSAQNQFWPPGARAAGVAIGTGASVWYLADPPPPGSATWAGTAAQVLATLLLALVLDARAFRSGKMRRIDAMAAIVALMAAVGALIAAVRIAAYDEALPVVLGALVVGACVSLTWIVLTDVLDPLRDRARRRD